MGQKVNPHGLRVGIIKGWDSNGMPTETMKNTYWKILKSVNSLKINCSYPVFLK